MSAGVRMIAASSVVSCLLALAARNSPPPPASAAPEPPAAGVVGSAIGRDLDAADKDKAIATQQEAVNSGARNYGFIEPGPEGPAVSGACRDCNHKIFINGRAQQAKGQACRRPDGSWRVVS